MYKIIKNPFSNEITSILRLRDTTFIPLDQGNIDYQEYLRWVDEGNEPEPSDETI